MPLRRRERCMQGFRLRRFVACQSAVRNHFSIPARRGSANATRYHRLEAFDAWQTAASVRCLSTRHSAGPDELT